MRIVQLNSSLHSSPGTLMKILSHHMEEAGIDNRMLITSGKADAPLAVSYSSDGEVKREALKSRMSGNYGFVSDAATKRLISLLEDYQPDLIQIHTIHGHDLNEETFFQWVKDRKIPVVYTFHDCWQFTGYCPYYTWTGCTKWQEECHDCPLRKRYSWLRDHSRENFSRKKQAMDGLNLHIVTPSRWLKEETGKSFLKNVDCQVIPNGIHTALFHPMESDLKKKFGIEGKHMILAAAMKVSPIKGIKDLIELSQILPEDFRLVLVGVPEEARKEIPAQIIARPRTASQEELAQYYSAASVLVNPTHEDNFPTVNLEALSCGTPIVSYGVGGSAEAFDEYTGMAVPENDIEALKNACMELAGRKSEISMNCRDRAVSLFDEKQFAERYLNLYQKILSRKA